MPTQMRAIVDKLLTNVSNGLFPVGFIAEAILPEIKVKQRSGKIGKYGNGHLRIVNTVTGGKNKYAMVDSITRDATNYLIESHALKDIVTQEDKDNVEKPFDAEKDVTEALVYHLLIGKERGLAQTLGDTAIITQNETLTGTAQFNDYTNSDPLGKFQVARRTVRAGCGFRPNIAIMDSDVADVLKFHPQLLDKLGYKFNRSGGLTIDELAKVLEVKKVHIAECVFNNSKKGQADSIEPVWGRDLIFAHQPDRPALKQQSLGYRVQYVGRKPRQVYKSFPDEPVGSTKVMVLDDYDMLLTNTSCAFLYKNAIAPLS